jgi:hypothetical protein
VKRKFCLRITNYVLRITFYDLAGSRAFAKHTQRRESPAAFRSAATAATGRPKAKRFRAKLFGFVFNANDQL